MIRAKLLQDLRKALARARFLPDDFTVAAETMKDGSSVLTVRCRFEADYYLTATIPATQGAEIRGQVSPGAISQVEAYKVSYWQYLMDQVQQWVDRVREELSATPVAREFAAHARELEELIAKHAAIGDGYFTKEEAEQLRSRLDEIEAQLRQHLEQHSTDPKATEVKVNAIHQDVEVLKDGVGTLKKKNWATAATVRIANWLRDPENRTIIQSGAEIAKRLLLKSGE